MSRRRRHPLPLWPIITVLLIAGFAGGLLLLNARDHEQATSAPVTARAAAPQPYTTPSPAERVRINKQDPPDPERQALEERVQRERPLLERLPVTVRGVTVDVGGLAPDNKRTVIDVRGGRTVQDALAVYEALLKASGDSGKAYLVTYIGK